ncbi:MAG: tail fiber domain-containing protein [Limisphaerales bacterium]
MKKLLLFGTAVCSLFALNLQLSTAHAQGTAFTYQGQLQDNGAPANGTYDFRFQLYDTNAPGNPAALVAGPVTNSAVAVSNGLFTTTIDFGAGVFDGSTNVWLQIGVQTNGASGWAALSPRQQITPAPYAILAGSVSGLSIQQNADGAPNVIEGSSGNFVAGGVEGATIGGGGAVDYEGDTNTVTADFGTVGGGEDNTAASIRATVAGGSANVADGDTATVGGGFRNHADGGHATIGGGDDNTASGPSSMVGGGAYNNANNDSATVSGGNNNNAGGIAATVSGGSQNSASADISTVVGGYANSASGSGAFVGGGGAITQQGGIIEQSGQNIASGEVSVVVGGLGNQATNDYATVPGGENNIAGGQYSFAAGQQAQALNDGAFVWADSQNATFSSTANDQFLIRAQGGVGINTASPHSALTVSGVTTFTNAGTSLTITPGQLNGTAMNNAVTLDIVGVTGKLGIWDDLMVSGSVYANGVLLTSDRNAKEDFESVNPETVLAKVSSLPITEWNYKTDAATQKHIGPMAQDFHAAFDLNGKDDKHISVIDEGGVALAAIQGLNQKLNEKDAEIQDLKQRLDRLEKLVSDSAEKH